MMRSLAFVLGFCVAAGGSDLLAQQAQGDVPTLRAQANLVVLDVVVDSAQRPVHGISKDKFHVFEDGKPQTLTVFDEHRSVPLNGDGSPGGHGAGAFSAGAGPAGLGPDTYTNLPARAPGTANVLLLDGLNTAPADQTYARQQMVDYLRKISPGTRIAIFTLGSRLQLVEPFTTDASMLSRALTGKGSDGLVRQQSSVLDPQFAQAQSDTLNEMATLGGDATSLAALGQFQNDLASFQVDQRVNLTMDAMQQIARYLQPFPGRKNLIWFSGSFPLEITTSGGTPSAFNAVRDYSDQVRMTDTMLGAARVAVYPVDARGLLTGSLANASLSTGSTSLASPLSSSRRTKGAITPTTGGYAAVQQDDKQRISNIREHASMQQVAAETGGVAYFDGNDLASAVAAATAHGSDYYTVGFVPVSKAADGVYHELKVVVDGEQGVAYRHGYFAVDASKSPGALKGDPRSALNLMRAAVEPNAPPMSEVLFKVHVAPAAAGTLAAHDAAANLTVHAAPGKPAVKTKLYGLDYGVPAHRLAFPLGTDGRYHGQMEFTVVAFDARGNRLNFVDQSAPLNLTADEYQQVLRSGILLHQQLELPVGQVFLRVVVHDVSGNAVGALEIPVLVPKA